MRFLGAGFALDDMSLGDSTWGGLSFFWHSETGKIRRGNHRVGRSHHNKPQQGNGPQANAYHFLKPPLYIVASTRFQFRKPFGTFLGRLQLV